MLSRQKLRIREHAYLFSYLQMNCPSMWSLLPICCSKIPFSYHNQMEKSYDRWIRDSICLARVKPRESDRGGWPNIGCRNCSILTYPEPITTGISLNQLYITDCNWNANQRTAEHDIMKQSCWFRQRRHKQDKKAAVSLLAPSLF